jgi:hypothetical protein
MKRIYFLSTVFIAFLLLAGSMTTMATTGGTVIQPTSTGIVWVAGNTYNITWTTVSPAQAVDIYLSTDDSFEFASDTKIFDNVTSTTTSVSWSIPGAQTPGDYWIFITTADDGNPDPDPVALDGSNNSFEIATTGPGGTGTIHVNQPNVTGIQWAPGQEVGIYWDYDLGLDVKLELYVHDGGSPGSYVLYTATATGLPATVSGSGYIWTIPSNIVESTDYKIRVSSTTTTDDDYSDNEFSITTSPVGGTYITLIQPEDAGIQWVPGTTRLISWDDDLLENVKIELLEHDGGTPGSYVLHSVLSASTAGTTFDWAIPALLDENTYKIRISSTDAGTSVSPVTSTNAFEITNTPSGGTTITLIQPEVTGIQWLNEGTYVISWMDDLIEDVKIQLLEDDGVTLVDPADSGIPDALYAGTTWDWTIPDATTLLPGDYKIRIYSSANGSIEAISTNTFEVASAPNGGTYIDLIQPNIAGIEWASGTDHLVSWMDDLLEPVSFELWYDNGGTWEEYTAEPSGLPSDVEGTTFIWSIPNAATLTPGTYKIRAESSYDGVIFDISDNTFDIVEFQPGGEITVYQPNGGEEWQIGGTYYVSWTDNVSEPVTLEYTINGVDWTEIATDVEGSTYVWNTATTATPGAASTTCKVRVTSTTQSGITDASDADFSFVNTIGGDVEVISPNGGEQWVAGNTYYIVWNDELVENVYIQLWKDMTLIDAADANLPEYDGDGVSGSTYEWTIPTGVLANGDDYWILIESVLDPAYYDNSDMPFTITDEPSGGTFITVNTPNGGEVWTIGETRVIWWDDDLIENVDIDLVDADDEFIAEIANDVPSIGNYIWDISSASYGIGTYKVFIYSHVDGPTGINDYSDATFELIEGKSPLANLLENGSSSAYAMYPNPVDNVLNIASANTIDHVQIQSLVGQVVYEGEINASQTTINTQEFTPGVYVVMIESAGNIETQKLIVK